MIYHASLLAPEARAEASSLMHAAYAGVEAWAKFCSWPSDGVLEVRSG